MAFHVFQCTGCEATLFPERYLCPRCGGGHWRQVEASAGIVEQLTRLVDRTPGSEPVLLATIRTEPEAFVIAQLEAAMTPGQRVRLQVVGEGKVVASRA
ncbi:rubredoxin [Trinickia violacea]|uniref:Rubredoxin n=1 Tax=Trinickia violacea TaxID=2571746 RepID=A0A4P8ILQ8_9BURK|nr:rubredoxin [Trinickia violacea]QCP49848.1 rubredoxin [Trinickia violacea]